MRTRCMCCRLPRVLRCVLRRLCLKTRILGPSDSPTSEAVTTAPSTSGLPTDVESPPTISTRSKRTVEFFSASSPTEASSSTSSSSPASTRYCLPPLSITANMNPISRELLPGTPPSLRPAAAARRHPHQPDSAPRDSASHTRGRQDGGTYHGVFPSSTRHLARQEAGPHAIG